VAERTTDSARLNIFFESANPGRQSSPRVLAIAGPAWRNSPPSRLRRPDHGSDVAVLENRAPALPRSAFDDIHHSPGQVIGPNHLVGKQHSKRRINSPQQMVTEGWFLPRLHGIDVGGPEDVNVREPRGE